MIRGWIWLLILHTFIFSGGLFIGVMIGNTNQNQSYFKGYNEGCRDAIKTFIGMQQESNRELYDEAIRKAQ